MGNNGAGPAVSVSSLEKVFGAFTAVDKVSFTVGRGGVFALIGPNGAGKSTIIKMLTTLMPPTSGTATVAGYDIVKHPTNVRQSIGYIPQLLSSDGSLTARENLLLSARLYGIPRSEQAGRIAEALEFMGLDEFSDQLVQSYSGGMIRRLEIAQSMLHRPTVIFMDEPTVGLDPLARKAVWDHVRELREKYRMTIILTTHYMDEVEELCDRMALLQHGRIVAIDTPARLKEAMGTGATLDDVFSEYMGITGENFEGGNYSEVRRNRSSIASRS